ncbi:MAG: choice-of-anchor Q domain-containing protein, partial [Pseudomonadales bacterium]|nr:choice-of-anchor Q domain-containing protein [Pseudomonadales bacterium]
SDFGGVIYNGIYSSLSIDNCSFIDNAGVLLSSVRSKSLSVIYSIVEHRSYSILSAKDVQTMVLKSNEFHCSNCGEMLSHAQKFGNQPSDEIEISKNLLRGGGNISIAFPVDYLVGPKITIEGNEISFVNSSVDASKIELVGYDSLDFVNNTVLEGLVRLSPKFDGNQYTSLVNNIFSNSGGETNQVSLEAFTRSDEISHNLIQRFSKGWDIEKSNDSSEPIFASIEQLDLKLVLDSPGINAGDNDVVKDAEATDRDGSPRIVGSVIDIGAYERFTGLLHPADADGNSSISQAEFAAYNASWRTNDVWATAPSIIPIDFVTRAGYLLEKGGAYKNIGVGKPQTWVPENE